MGGHITCTCRVCTSCKYSCAKELTLTLTRAGAMPSYFLPLAPAIYIMQNPRGRLRIHRFARGADYNATEEEEEE